MFLVVIFAKQHLIEHVINLNIELKTRNFNIEFINCVYHSNNYMFPYGENFIINKNLSLKRASEKHFI